MWHSFLIKAGLRARLAKGLPEDFTNEFLGGPDVSEYMAAARGGEAARGWYKNATAALVEWLGEDAPRFVGVLAATSPRSAPSRNLQGALAVWSKFNKWRADRGGVTPTYDEALEFVRVNKSFFPKATVMEGHIPNIARALSAPDPSTTDQLLSGAKVDPFRQNLLGNLSKATLDAWQTYFGHVGKEWVEGEPGPGGLLTADEPHHALSGMVGEAARRLTQEDRQIDPHASWSPAEVQEAIWSFSKGLAEHAGRLSLEQGRLVGGHEALETLTRGHVRKQQDFLTALAKAADPKDPNHEFVRSLGPEAVERLRAIGAKARAASSQASARDQELAVPHESDRQALELTARRVGRYSGSALPPQGGYRTKIYREFGDPVEGGKSLGYAQFPEPTITQQHIADLKASFKTLLKGLRSPRRGKQFARVYAHMRVRFAAKAAPAVRLLGSNPDLLLPGEEPHAIYHPNTVAAMFGTWSSDPSLGRPMGYDQTWHVRELHDYLRENHPKFSYLSYDMLAKGDPTAAFVLSDWLEENGHDPAVVKSVRELGRRLQPLPPFERPQGLSRAVSKAMVRIRLAKVLSPSASPPAPAPGTPAQSQAAVASSSSTEEGLSHQDAYERMRSSNTAAFKKIVDGLLQQVGVKGQTKAALGDWEDGAENSILQRIDDPPSPETIRYLAAWHGLLGNQRAVLSFYPRHDGADSFYKIHVPQSDLSQIRQQLNQAQIPFRTLVPTKQGTEVWVMDQGRKWRQQISNFAAINHADVHESTGIGEYLGGPTRSAARAAYRKIIDAYESKHSRGKVPPVGQAIGGNSVGAPGSPLGGPAQAPIPPEQPTPNKAVTFDRRSHPRRFALGDPVEPANLFYRPGFEGPNSGHSLIYQNVVHDPMHRRVTEVANQPWQHHNAMGWQLYQLQEHLRDHHPAWSHLLHGAVVNANATDAGVLGDYLEENQIGTPEQLAAVRGLYRHLSNQEQGQRHV